jgi:hypothetical protein
MTSLFGLMVFFLVMTLLVLAGLGIFLWRRLAPGGEADPLSSPVAGEDE